MIGSLGSHPLTAKSLERSASIGLVALVGFSTFYAAPSIISNVDRDLETSQAGGGSALTQLLYVGLFVGIVGALLVAGRGDILQRTPRFLLVTLSWCWFSLIWAADPAASFRRLVFVTVVVLSASYIIEVLSYDRFMRVFAATLGIIVIADWLAVLLLPAATRSLLDPLDPAGGWRGLHLEKNEAGAVLANCLIVFVHETIRSRSRLTGPLLCVACGVLLVQTHSKTSIGFSGLSLLLGAVCSAAYTNMAVRGAALLAFVGVVLTAIGVSDLVGPEIQSVLDDPTSFTGRSQIWAVLVEYSRDHFLFGAGYGSFWGIGDNSPILTYGGGWLANVYAAHNGYLELLVNIGIIGLAIGVCELVVRPFAVVFTKPLPSLVSRSMLCALVTFACLHNLLEATFLNRAYPSWVIAILAYSVLFKTAAEARHVQPHIASVRQDQDAVTDPSAQAARHDANSVQRV